MVISTPILRFPLEILVGLHHIHLLFLGVERKESAATNDEFAAEELAQLFANWTMHHILWHLQLQTALR